MSAIVAPYKECTSVEQEVCNTMPPHKPQEKKQMQQSVPHPNEQNAGEQHTKIVDRGNAGDIEMPMKEMPAQTDASAVNEDADEGGAVPNRLVNFATGIGSGVLHAGASTLKLAQKHVSSGVSLMRLNGDSEEQNQIDSENLAYCFAMVLNNGTDGFVNGFDDKVVYQL